jgi:glycosyltransferase involved in cell wall biosynthesis
MATASPDIVEKPNAIGIARDIRVAWLFPSLARGYYWQPVFKEFTTRCPHTAVFTSIWPGFAPGYENSFAIHTLPGLRYVDLKKRRPDARTGFSLTPLSILKKLADFGPDVVFSAGFSGWTVCALLFRLLRGSRVIIFWEGCSVHALGSSKAQTVLRRWIARFADAAVSNADEGSKYLRDVIGMPEHKLLCHPCQVPDLPLLCSGAGGADLPALKRPVFLFVGGLTWRKGWRYLIEACALLVRQGFQNFSVLLVGAGEQEETRKAIRDYGLDGVVYQVGPVAYNNLGMYYRSADVFVSPTRQDTWGVAVLEAMAFGKPVLCSKYAGSRQMVAHGDNGFIFDPSDAQQLAGYMAKFIADEYLAKRLGARSLEKMVSFTPAHAADVLANLALQAHQTAAHATCGRAFSRGVRTMEMTTTAVQDLDDEVVIPSQALRPLFVLSVWRSGSSLLYALLNQHSKVALLYEGDLPQLHLYLWGSLRSGAWRERWEFWNQGPSRHGIAIESMPARVSDVWEATRIVYQEVARRKHATIWGEKTPHWYDCPLRKAEKFPDARFIFLWRDLHAVIGSMARAAITHHFFRKRSLARKAILGNERLREACDALKMRGRPVHEVNYEDLASNTSECMRKICQFLEVPFEPSVASLEGADRSAISEGDREHHALVRSDRIVHQRKHAVILSPSMQAKIDRYIFRWKQRYGDTWPKYPSQLPHGTKPPDFAELWGDRLSCGAAQYWDKAVTLGYAMTPLAVIRLWRSRSRPAHF